LHINPIAVNRQLYQPDCNGKNSRLDPRKGASGVNVRGSHNLRTPLATIQVQDYGYMQESLP